MKDSITTLQLAALWESANSDDPLEVVCRRLMATIDYTTEFLLENDEDSDLYQEMSDANEASYEIMQSIKKNKSASPGEADRLPGELLERCGKLLDSVREILRLLEENSIAQKLPVAL